MSGTDIITMSGIVAITIVANALVRRRAISTAIIRVTKMDWRHSYARERRVAPNEFAVTPPMIGDRRKQGLMAVFGRPVSNLDFPISGIYPIVLARLVRFFAQTGLQASTSMTGAS
jgi:hypothetical protein